MMTWGSSKQRNIIILLTILAMAFTLRLAFLHEPFERDEGQYAYIAQEILHGSIPYRDVIEFKPPGVFYIYALAITLFGDTTESIRLFTAYYSLFTVIVIYLIARNLRGVWAGLLAALLYGIYSSGPLIQASGSNVEVFMALPLSMSLWYYLCGADSGKRVYIVLSGISASCAMLIKPVALPQVVLLFIFLFLLPKSRESIKELLINIMSFVLPVLIIAAIVIGYFAYHGALEDFLYWTVDFTRSKYVKSNEMALQGRPLFSVLGIIFFELFLPAVVALPTAIWLISKELTMKYLFAALLIFAAAIGVYLPGKNHPHYFIQLLPPLSISAGIGLSMLLENKRLLAKISLSLVLCMFIYTAYKEYRLYTTYTSDEVSIIKYGPIFVQSVAVAKYIKERTQPSDYIFQWGFEPELYFLTERRCPVSYEVNMLVGWAKYPDMALQKLEAGINKNKPKYIIMMQGWNCLGLDEMLAILSRDYQYEGMMYYAYIFRRKGVYLN
jgi:4-amino-4-deoxy-L-arabinose transferase-like glycosyltransferase